MDEIVRDRLRLLSQESIFLREDAETDKVKSVNDGHTSDFKTDKDADWKDKAKETASNMVSNLKDGGIAAVKYMKDAIYQMNKEKEQQDEERLIDEDVDRIDKIVGFSCKYAVCSLFITPFLGWIPAIIWEKAKDEQDMVKRKKIYSRVVSDVHMLDAKIKDLNEKQDITDAEKAQKYKLIQLRQKLYINANKLKGTLEYGTDHQIKSTDNDHGM